MAPSFIGVLCALALVSSSSGAPPLAPTVHQAVSASGPSSITLGASALTGEASSRGAAPAGARLTPAVDPEIRPASPTAPLAPEPLAPDPLAAQAPTPEAPATEPLPASSTSGAAAAAPAAATEETDPWVPSIPPLWAPDEELGSPSDSPMATSEATTVPAPEALIPDSNAAAVLTVFNKINEYRLSKGLNPVKYHATVAGMAQEWSDSIASREVIEHRASFWTDPRALNPNNGAGEVIAIRTDRDAALLVEWWKGSAGHNAMLLDPRFNVMGAGITYTDRTYKIWGVVNFFGYTTLPAGTTDSPGGGTGPSTAFPPPAPTLCDAPTRHMPPTLDLSAAAIKGPGDLVTVDSAGQLLARTATGARTFAPARVIGSGFAGAKEVFTTDWDRDGAYDLLTQWTNGTLSLHRGVASGGFQAPATLGNGGWETLTLAVGGWCANNRMPQILALDGAGGLYLYPNKGLGDLSARATVATGVGAARKLSMVDYDADGFQDLLALRGDGSVQLHRGWGTTALRAEARASVATGWGDVTGIRPLRDVTGLNSTGVALRRAGDVVQYWDLTAGSLASPSNIPGPWTGQRLAH
ncbi:CAP domain-containing protein [Pseudarthrobacter phenanthrenivorans]|uniref:CAP domain-containing protein n=1 Tax=Pseudarthrobacter phenanthrenivorans TaxID=361575 RepID=UPI0020B71F77|nr:CAP domain-containing protein [Pseudarthrobacter phenanthrenivorans]